MAVGDTVETLLAVYILKYFGLKTSFTHLKDIVLLIFVAVFSTAISATIGVSSLYVKGIISSDQYILAWKTWWVSNALSILIIPPLIFTWNTLSGIKLRFTKVIEIVIFSIFMLCTDLIIYHKILNSYIDTSSSTYLVFPPLIWSALRFGVRGTSLVIFLVTTVSIIETANNLGPFINGNLAYSLLSLQTYIGTVTATIMILAIVECERKELEQRKDEFISMAGHELKTPLTSIKAFSQLLLKIHLKNKFTNMNGYLKKMDYQINNMAYLVNGLLNLSRIQSNSFEIHKIIFQLDKLVYEVVELLRETHHAKNIIIKNTAKENCNVFADKQFITQVLINLITNAIKYSPLDSKIIVGIKIINGKTVKISIKDYGIGINEAELDKIFDKYYRVYSINKQTVSGLGIGLYISNQIIKRHDGKITVISTKGKGSKFSFSLPIVTK